MPTLSPPEYPDHPEAPLRAFGPSFAEEIASSVIRAVWHGDGGSEEEAEVRIAASLTMLEAFHPRDQLECMMSAQGVGLHAAIMDSLAAAREPGMPVAMMIKLRTSASQMTRTFAMLARDMRLRHKEPLPKPPSGGKKPKASPVEPQPPSGPDDAPDRPEDIDTRPDGTPGSLAAYAPKPSKEVFIPKEAAINVALATRPKPWRLVDQPQGHAAEAASPPADAGQSRPKINGAIPRGPLDLTEKIFSGDALSRFASSRLDLDAPIEPLNFDNDDSVVELELVSTGGDPELEARRAEMQAAHPEGKPVVTLRYGGKKPPDEPPDG
jgi:hypothetical protein